MKDENLNKQETANSDLGAVRRSAFNEVMNETMNTPNADKRLEIHALLATALTLNSDKLAEAYDLLYGKSDKYSNLWKAKEMIAIFENQMQVRKPFENYIKCIEFLQRCC